MGGIEKKDRKIQVVMSEEMYNMLVECMNEDGCMNVSEEVRFLIQIRKYRERLIEEVMGRSTAFIFPRLEQRVYQVFQNYLESEEFSQKLQDEIEKYFDRLEKMVKLNDTISS